MLEERSAGNPHATFCGNRRRVTASGDPVLKGKFLWATHLRGVPGNWHSYRDRYVRKL